ncbi:MAG TPA: peptidoglycan-associated lipoprotein Pal [Vicinamibacterales bacterium]|nr:peptidoglycan-associated lipoprotein Pal [Vicinamibacterales bacterium]
MQMSRIVAVMSAVILVTTLSACAKKKPPVAKPVPMPPGGTSTTGTGRPPAPPTPVTEPQPVPVEPMAGDELSAKDLDDINKNSPFEPLFFGYDQAEVSTEGQQVLNTNAETLKKYPTWVITVEGHADERGTAEYNLALGERRALSARNYLVSLGIPADRLRTVSYGKEFPFDPAHTEEAYSKNRRAHFVVTSK